MLLVGSVKVATSTGSGLGFKDLAAPTIACLSLLFTLATFWWNNWRKGRLVVDSPRSFMVRLVEDRTLIKMPLVFQNSGARTLSIIAVRLHTGSYYLHFTRQYNKMTADNRDATFAAGFSIGGRGSQVFICEFEALAVNPLTPGRNDFSLEVLFSGERKWTRQGTLSIYIAEELFGQMGNSQIPFDNAKALPTETKRKLPIPGR